ncbi:MAG: hypothetical protein ACE5QF_06880 [Thermoplasmata archaeon]
MKRNEVVRDALRRKRKKETLEGAIGKAVRRSGGTYQDYIEIMSYIREKKELERLTLLDAARRVAEED